MAKKPQPYGFWTFGGRNGLEGSATTTRVLPDGRTQFVPDPDFPAILPDDQILYALQTSPPARDQFTALFPSLDPRSQKRLQDLLDANKSETRLVQSSQDSEDLYQKKGVVGSVLFPNPILQRITR